MKPLTPGGTSYSSRINGKYQMAGKTGITSRAISIKEREEGIIKNKDLPWEKEIMASLLVTVQQ